MEISSLAFRKLILDKRGGDCVKNKDLSRKFTSLKWEAKNTYLIMPGTISNSAAICGRILTSSV